MPWSNLSSDILEEFQESADKWSANGLTEDTALPFIRELLRRSSRERYWRNRSNPVWVKNERARLREKYRTLMQDPDYSGRQKRKWIDYKTKLLANPEKLEEYRAKDRAKSMAYRAKHPDEIKAKDRARKKRYREARKLRLLLDTDYKGKTNRDERLPYSAKGNLPTENAGTSRQEISGLIGIGEEGTGSDSERTSGTADRTGTG